MFRDLPRYADSTRNSFWLSRTPSHWRVQPGLAVLEENRRKNSGLIESQVLSLSYGRVVVKPIEKQRGLVPESYEGYQILDPGDIVVRPTDLQNDQTSIRIGHVKNRGIITSAYIGLRPSGDWSDSYAYQYLTVVDSSKRIYGMGSGLRQQLGWSDLKRMPCLVPPAEEQAAIVKYLAHANARIDNAIVAKRRLISLLEEQKASVAYDRLTRGYEPNDLRVVGLPWADSIPQHWAIAPVKRLFSSMVYGTSESSTGEGPVTAVGMGEIKNGHVAVVRRGGLKNIPEGLELRQNDLLFNRTNSPDLVGKVGRMTGDCEDLTFASYLVRCRVAKEIDPEWAAYLLNDRAFLGFARSQAFVSLHQANLSPTRYGALPAVIPPYDEQRRIAEGLRKELTEFNGAVDRVTREIQLLQEFRTRLVADVVTGQVDVRAIAATLPDEPESFNNRNSMVDDDLEEAISDGEE